MFNMPHKIILKQFLLLLAIASGAGLLASCASTKPRDLSWEWPLPPEQPRLRYVGSVRSSRDVKAASSMDSFKQLVGGESQAVSIVKPYGIAVHNNTMYVTDTVLGSLLVFDHTEKTFKVFGTSGAGRLNKPTGIAVDRQGHVYVTDSVDRRVVVFDSKGKYLTAMGGPKLLQRPVGVAINPVNNRVYVVDAGTLNSKHHAVSVFNKKGKHLFDFGKRGSKKGEFNFPTNISAGSDGRLYVVDTGNFRVQIFGNDGKFIDSFGSVGTALGSFARPKGIALDSDGQIYVIDAAFNNVQIFDQQKRLLLFAGQMGKGPGELWLPAGIHIGADDRIYIADQYNHRVQIWQYLKAKSDNKSNEKTRKNSMTGEQS